MKLHQNPLAIPLVIPIAISIACAMAACGGGEMSSRDYCTARQDAWERAFPDMPQSADDRRLFIDSCVKVTTEERATGEYAKRLRCLREHIKRGSDPNAEYIAMTRCEGGGPRPVAP